MTFSRIQAALLPLADAARAASMSAYMRGQFAFLGIPTPERRAAVAPILARRPLDWPMVWDCWDAAEREYQYVAVDHLRRFKNFPAAHREDVRQLVVTKSWWTPLIPWPRWRARRPLRSGRRMRTCGCAGWASSAS